MKKIDTETFPSSYRMQLIYIMAFAILGTLIIRVNLLKVISEHIPEFIGVLIAILGGILADAQTLHYRLPPEERKPTYIPIYILLFVIYGFFVILEYLLKGIMENALISIEIFLITLMASQVPSITSLFIDINRRFLVINFETILFTIIIFGGNILLNGSAQSVKNFIFIFGVFAILVYGSHLVKYHKEKIFNKLIKYFGFKRTKYELSRIEAVFNKEIKFYYVTPIIALAIGLIGGLLSWEKQVTILALIIVVLFVASIIVLFFLLNSFLLMIYPLFGKEILLDDSLKFTSTSYDEVLGFANMITNLRGILLYDSIHNLFLFFAFVFIMLNLLGITINIRILLISSLILSFIFIQLPHIIGQYLLHDKILEDYNLMEQVKFKEDLKKYAPLYPKFEFVAALIAPCTIGYFLFILLEGLLTSLIK
jgi:hypothetical protein